MLAGPCLRPPQGWYNEWATDKRAMVGYAGANSMGFRLPKLFLLLLSPNILPTHRGPGRGCHGTPMAPVLLKENGPLPRKLVMWGSSHPEGPAIGSDGIEPHSRCGLALPVRRAFMPLSERLQSAGSSSMASHRTSRETAKKVGEWAQSHGSHWPQDTVCATHKLPTEDQNAQRW